MSVSLPEITPIPLQIVKEFVPRKPNVALSAGRLIVRANNYGSELSRFNHFFEIMAADAQRFEPPLEITRDHAEIVHYAGQHYSGTFGLELYVPEGHVVPDDYARRETTEKIH